jgi:hypothetical protein
MSLLDPCEPGAGPIEQDNHRDPHFADDAETLSIGLAIGRLVEEESAGEEPGNGLVCEVAEQRCGKTNHIQVQDVKEERDTAIGLNDAAKPAQNGAPPKVERPLSAPPIPDPLCL